jgi:hypothetical protein
LSPMVNGGIWEREERGEEGRRCVGGGGVHPQALPREACAADPLQVPEAVALEVQVGTTEREGDHEELRGVVVEWGPGL